MSDVENWQNTCKNNKSRAEYFLHNEILTDCKFLVGEESDEVVTICGHKLILAMASPVFQRMFYGSFDDEKSNEILIPDIKHRIFHMMMDYIYLEKFELVTVEDAFELYSAAKKYMLQNLMEMCINHLTANFNHRNIVKIYEFADFFEENKLLTKSGDWMARNTLIVIEDPEFLDAKLTTLIALFERDRLVINSEFDLFNALNKYARANGYIDTKKSVENKEESGTGKRQLLREALIKIRFLIMTSAQFKIIAPSGLLTDSELLSILLNNENLGVCSLDSPMPDGFSCLKTQRQRNF